MSSAVSGTAPAQDTAGRTDWRVAPAAIKGVAYTIMSGPAFDGVGGVYELHIAGMACDGSKALADEILRDLKSHADLLKALETLADAVMADISEAKRRLDADIPKDAPVHPVSAFLTGTAIHVGKARAALSASRKGAA